VRIRSISAFILGSAFLLSVAAPAAAQTSTKAEVGVSYSFLHMYEVNAPVGFAFDFGKAITSIGNGSLGIVAEFGLNRFSGDDLVEAENQYSYMAGLRFAGPRTGRFRPFGQIVFGGLNSFEQKDFAMQPGAGVNINVRENMDWRVQVDIPVDFAESKTFTGFRFNVGLVWWVGQ
jgi:hypothetical protein